MVGAGAGAIVMLGLGAAGSFLAIGARSGVPAIEHNFISVTSTNNLWLCADWNWLSQRVSTSRNPNSMAGLMRAD